MKYIFILAIISMMACKPTVETPVEDKYKIDIVYYPERNTDYRDGETLDVKQITDCGDTYIFYYKKLMDYNDTIWVRKDNVFFRGDEARLLSIKTFNVQGKQINVKKYFYKQPTHVGLNLFFTDSGKLVLTKSFISHITEYDTKTYQKLHKALLKDTVFLRSEFKY